MGTPLREKVTNTVIAIDVSSDSTSISSGERLVGPLKHDRAVTGIKFSPNGGLIAVACYGGPVRVFDSRTREERYHRTLMSPNHPPAAFMVK